MGVGAAGSPPPPARPHRSPCERLRVRLPAFHDALCGVRHDVLVQLLAGAAGDGVVDERVEVELLLVVGQHDAGDLPPPSHGALCTKRVERRCDHEAMSHDETRSAGPATREVLPRLITKQAPLAWQAASAANAHLMLVRSPLRWRTTRRPL